MREEGSLLRFSLLKICSSFRFRFLRFLFVLGFFCEFYCWEARPCGVWNSTWSSDLKLIAIDLCVVGYLESKKFIPNTSYCCSIATAI